METLQLLKTTTKHGTYYSINGRRTTLDAYNDAKFGRRADTFITKTEGEVTRQYMTVYITEK